MEGLQMLSGLIALAFYLAAAIGAVVLLITVLRLRSEAVQINKRLRTVNIILRRVHKDALPAAQCRSCLKPVAYGQNNCTHCGSAIEWL